jgi:hypothetical protein
MIAVLAGMTSLKRRIASFSADRRGAVAIEMLFVWPVLFFLVMIPIADIAFASFQYISARQALRAFGQAIQYSPPSDFASTSAWESAAIAKADPSYPIDNIAIICGDSGADCSPTNIATPRYYTFTTTFTVTPLLLSSVLCSSSCTITLPYSQRFY